MAKKTSLMDVLLEIKEDFPKSILHDARWDPGASGMTIDEVIETLEKDLKAGSSDAMKGSHYRLMESPSTGQLGIFHDDDEKNAMLTFVKKPS